jgi:succinoglycan biosynthesis transport protein ExoP
MLMSKEPSMEQFSLRELVLIARRRKAVFLITFAAIFLLALSFAAFWPAKYRSIGTVQILQPDIPQQIVSPTGSGTADAIQAFADLRIEQINEKITATENLVDIITKFNLYSDLRKSASMASAVSTMQKRIKLSLLSADMANPTAAVHLSAGQLAAVAFTISFDYSDPLVTQQVANELISRFIDEDLKLRRQQAAAQSNFLADQIKSLEANLSEQEKRMADFRTEHSGARPEDSAFNMQMEATSGQSVDSIHQQLASLDNQKGNLEVQLAGIQPYSTIATDGTPLTTPALQLKALQGHYSTAAAQYGPSHPDVIKLRKQIDSLEAQLGIPPDTANIQSQINDVRAKLAQDQKSYGPDYPEILTLKRKLVGLAAEQQARGALPTAYRETKDADNPAYLVLKSQLSALEEQRKSLFLQLATTQEQHELYAKRVGEAPANEREYAALSRDYDNSQLRYRELKEKKLAADMNEQVEQGRQGERLAVIEAPDLPTSPRMPPRRLAIAGGIIFGLFGGLFMAYVAENMSQAVYGTQALGAIVGLPPLVAIPYISNSHDLALRERWQKFYIALPFLLAVAAAGICNWFFIPLDVLWVSLLQGVGL